MLRRLKYFSFVLLFWLMTSPAMGREVKNISLVDAFKRPHGGFDLGGGASATFIIFADDDGEMLPAIFGYGGNASFHYQGRGHGGFQIPFSYQFFSDGTDGMNHVFHGGLNYIHHFVRGDSPSHADPYFLVGATLFIGTENGVGLIPLLNTGVGYRHYVTKNVGWFIEGSMHSLLIVNQFEGKVGITFAF